MKTRKISDVQSVSKMIVNMVREGMKGLPPKEQERRLKSFRDAVGEKRRTRSQHFRIFSTLSGSHGSPWARIAKISPSNLSCSGIPSSCSKSIISLSSFFQSSGLGRFRLFTVSPPPHLQPCTFFSSITLTPSQNY